MKRFLSSTDKQMSHAKTPRRKERQPYSHMLSRPILAAALALSSMILSSSVAFAQEIMPEPVATGADARRGNAEARYDAQMKPGEFQIYPSFENASYYLCPADPQPAQVTAEYRKVGEQDWHPTFATLKNEPVGIWKGSALGLAEDSEYQLRLLGDGKEIAQQNFRTWTSNPPIAKTIDLSTIPNAQHGLIITDVGTPDGWIVYTAPKGWTIVRQYDVNDKQRAAIVFQNAAYVMLKDVAIVGGERDAILVDHCDSVRIENCELSGWGKAGTQQWTNDGQRGKYRDDKGKQIDHNAGVAIVRSANTVVERCYIHDPIGRSNAWTLSHPSGPEGFFVDTAVGGSVLRWNDVVGSDEHRWNDASGSSRNSFPDGGFCRDSDIYGNYYSLANDDGIELEGGGMNLRFYGNKLEGFINGVSTGATRLGPQIIYGNILTMPGDELGISLGFFKNSYPVSQQIRYVMNNTCYGYNASVYSAYGGAAEPFCRGYLRNNIFMCADTRAPGDWAQNDNFDNDLFWARDNREVTEKFLEKWRALGHEEHAIIANPDVVNAEQGDFQLSADSPARGKSVEVTDLVPAGADMGAFFGPFKEIPVRPLALIAAPRQLNFEVPILKSAMPVELTVPASAKAPVSFQIRQNEVFTWFKVEPASGEVKPGGSLTLNVTVDKDKLVGRPIFKGAFLVRTAEGLSRPVSVYAKGDFTEQLRRADAPNTIYLNVADMPELQPLLKTTTLPNVFGGKYVFLDGKNKQPVIDLKFKIANAGKYSLMARIGSPVGGGGRRGLGVALDGQPKQMAEVNAGFQWNEGTPEAYRLVYIGSLDNLTAGEHSIRITPTRNGLDLNEFVITDNPAVFLQQDWQLRAP